MKIDMEKGGDMSCNIKVISISWHEIYMVHLNESD